MKMTTITTTTTTTDDNSARLSLLVLAIRETEDHDYERPCGTTTDDYYGLTEHALLENKLRALVKQN